MVNKRFTPPNASERVEKATDTIAGTMFRKMSADTRLASDAGTWFEHKSEGDVEHFHLAAYPQEVTLSVARGKEGEVDAPRTECYLEMDPSEARAFATLLADAADRAEAEQKADVAILNRGRWD